MAISTCGPAQADGSEFCPLGVIFQERGAGGLGQSIVMADPRMRQQGHQPLLHLGPHGGTADFDVAQMVAGVAQAFARHAQDQVEPGRHQGQAAGLMLQQQLQHFRRIAQTRDQQHGIAGLGHAAQSAQAEGMTQWQGDHFQVIGQRLQEGIDIRGGLRDLTMREQHALAGTRGARGEEQVGRIIQRAGTRQREPWLPRRRRPTGVVWEAAAEHLPRPWRERAPLSSITCRRVASVASASKGTAMAPRLCTAK